MLFNCVCDLSVLVTELTKITQTKYLWAFARLSNNPTQSRINLHPGSDSYFFKIHSNIFKLTCSITFQNRLRVFLFLNYKIYNYVTYIYTFRSLNFNTITNNELQIFTLQLLTYDYRLVAFKIYWNYEVSKFTEVFYNKQIVI